MTREEVEKDLDVAKARIRELEAGLLVCRQARSKLEWECGRLAQLANEATARAEKAEKALEVAEAQVYRWSAGQRDTEQRLADSEARIAELEALFDDMEANGLLKRPWRETVGDETPPQGVHEREAD